MKYVYSTIAIVIVLTLFALTFQSMLETMTWAAAMRRTGITISILGAFALVYILHHDNQELEKSK